jgi:hypothetical protein
LSKLLINFLEAFGDLFVAAAKAAFQSSPGTRANLHKVEEYTTSQVHRPTPVPTMHPPPIIGGEQT